jgi:CheY-like chemotaxis protein
VSTKILIAEDEAELRLMLKTSMEHAGYEVVTASNGLEALDRIRSDTPDVVLLDVLMPDMDGFEALSKLKANPSTSHIPVVMLTGLNDDTDISKGWKLGTSLYMTKPFVPEQLISYIQNVLERD